MPKIVIILLISLVALYLILLVTLYFFQEKLIFFPEKLSREHEFSFNVPFVEEHYTTSKGVTIHGLHFKAENPQGMVLYFHGNAGSLDTWGHVAEDFVSKGYDMLITDYRGYGKSSGLISNEKCLHLDAEHIYEEAKKKFPENKIVVYGRSLGTGIATKLASAHNPQLLFLETPFFNFEDVVKHHYKMIPTSFVLKYQFTTDIFIKKVKCPIYLVHGTEDELIPYDSSVRLAKNNDSINLITIEGGKHNNLPDYPEYHEALKEALGKQSN